MAGQLVPDQLFDCEVDFGDLTAVFLTAAPPLSEETLRGYLAGPRGQVDSEVEELRSAGGPSHV